MTVGFIAAAGIVMQVALGAVYAWSVFEFRSRGLNGWTSHRSRLLSNWRYLCSGSRFRGRLW